MAVRKKAGGAGAPKQDLATKLRRDVTEALEKEFGDNPKLVAEVEAVLERVADVALADLVAKIRNPIVRAIVREALHKAIDAAFEVI